jgi:cystathionine beta-lyase
MTTITQILNSIPVDELTGAIKVPIYQTSTFVQEEPGVHKGFDYSRTNNPTRQALEKLIATIEGGSTGLAFASGLAAIDVVLKSLKAGDEIIAVDDIYGGAFRLFTHVYEKFDIRIRYVDTTDATNVAAAITSNTKLIWIESPTNPTLKISDISAIARIAHQHNVLLCVDNTFASPVSQKPLDLGADIVVHSATKYLGGHGDLIAGLVVTKNADLGDKLKFLQNASGGILGPFDSWLVIRGLETLPLRIQRHATSAQAVAEFLETVPEVDKVFYPGLTSHPQHDVAKKQQRYFGGVVSFTLQEDTAEAARLFTTSTQLIKLAESLGSTKSLICHPASMTHKSIPVERRRQAGVADSLIRISIGLEEPEDIIADLKRAFQLVKLKTELVEQHV